MRTFETGATRDGDKDKLDYEGFLCPLVLRRYAEFMHKNRFQADGQVRDGGNWKKGIPRSAYMKSAFRHFMSMWQSYTEGKIAQEEICALLFNLMGLLHEELKAERADK